MATTPTTIKAGTPRDFLGLVPALLGFTPHASLVLVPFEATRTIGAMRFDLDTDAGRETLQRSLKFIADHQQ